MTTIDHPRHNRRSTGIAYPALSLVLLGVLAGCSDSGTSVESSGNTDTISATATNTENSPFAIRPSRSAAELSDGSVATVQTALLPASEAVTREPESTEPSVGAANPDTDNTETDGPTDTDNTESSAENSTDTDSGDTGNTQPEAEQSEQSEPDNGTSGGSETSSPDNNPSETPELENGKTSFTSVSTPGFDGEVLEDSIRIRWAADPDARGYNVYRQAEYYTTVFDTEFVDTDVYDDDYYYEIQAFDNDENYKYVATGLTVRSRTLGKIDPDAAKPNDNLLDNYELVFSEEFTGTQLDPGKWDTSFLWGPDLIINGEEQYYVDVMNDPDFGFNPFSFDGENMTINTIETPDELRSKANDQPYLSGIITSYSAFKFTYGYFETRAKMTHGRGYWPAFWLLNAYYGGADPEIDIMEFIGHNQDVMYHTYHYFDSNGELRSTKSFPVPGIDFTEDFHTFGVEWKPGSLVFYVDRIETMRISDANVSQEEMYILANQAVGGWWAGSPDSETPFPGKYTIDYIRAYQSTVQLDEIQFDQPNDLIPLFADDPGSTTPNHKPPFWLWPEGYPGRQ